MNSIKPPARSKLEDRLAKQIKQLNQAKKNQRTLLAATVYLGVLGVVFVLPVIAGAYLGRWLDGLQTGYSTRWTLSLIFLGLVIGFMNAYLLLREKDDRQ